MKLSDPSLKFLSEFILGGTRSPYRSGPDLVQFFRNFGYKDTYGYGFPSRGSYVAEKLRELNGTARIEDVLAGAFDQRVFLGTEYGFDDAVALLNEYLAFDGAVLVRSGRAFRVAAFNDSTISLDGSLLLAGGVTQQAIDDSIAKCRDKLARGDFSGAITNARTLVEAVLLGIERDLANAASAYNGDLIQLFKRVQRLLDLGTDRKDLADPLRQMLGGLASIVNSLAAMRNKMSDAHAATYVPEQRHAKLAVNAAATLCEFLVASKAQPDSPLVDELPL